MYSAGMRIRTGPADIKQEVYVRMSEKEKLELLEEIFDVEEPLQTDMVLSELEEWDSLTTLSLAVKVKELYGKNLTADEINAFVTIQDICGYLE